MRLQLTYINISVSGLDTSVCLVAGCHYAYFVRFLVGAEDIHLECELFNNGRRLSGVLYCDKTQQAD